MKKTLLALLAMGTMMTMAQAESPKKMMKPFQAVSKGEATLLQDGKAKAFCPECGMTLPMFYKTNHASTVNGKAKQYCSIHCVVKDTQNGSKLTDIKVVDVTTLKFIDASKAFYVVGSRKKGTMSMVSKYAFGLKADADTFAKANGGEVVDYASAYKTAQGDFKKDSTMIGKKQAMMSKKGEMIYSKMCQKTEEKFATVADAKASIVANKLLCKELNGKQLQAVGLYLKNR